MTRESLKSAILSLTLGLGLMTATAIPSRAGVGDLIACLLGGCSSQGNNQSTGSGSDVEVTGVVQTIYIVGDTFFPNTVHANYGDEIKFHNLVNAAIKVEATNGSWSSDAINKNKSWSFIVQPGLKLSFQKKQWFSNMKGEVKIGEPNASVNYGDLIDYNGNVVGKDGVVVKVADGLGKTLADLGGTVRKVGNGLALGLTTTLGLGNN
ncbi:hypothetical protein GCM10011360_05930 [Primorskyibacter flagellatus]|uniref:Lipoprotein n=1 Tax=Primorskyibacter flagellatus TaxID=1387277 RepID=A0A917A0N5_9RHOB|nr:hypothetical protein [Primorskyibacter flagellatus]GGE20010.1 hypothetical protein GCM10011360_05930 [Primorskyibacter flagellatus]